MAHTQGPWEVECVETEHHGYPGWNTYTIRSPQNVCLAVVGEVDHYHQNDHTANARLIASAPDMLNILKDAALMLGTLTGENLAVYARTFSVLAEDVIRKAEGE